MRKVVVMVGMVGRGHKPARARNGEAASAKGEYAGKYSGLEADGCISIEAENKRGRASLSFLAPFDHTRRKLTARRVPRCEILAGAWDYGAAQISRRFRIHAS